jgi:hypothetical protein
VCSCHWPSFIGREGGRGGVRLGSTGANLCSSPLISPKSHRVRPHGGRFSGLEDSWHENTSRDGTNARLQCPQTLRITRKSSSRPGFHPGVFPALLSQGGSGVLSKRPGRKDQDLGLISTRIQQGRQVPPLIRVLVGWLDKPIGPVSLRAQLNKRQDSWTSPASCAESRWHISCVSCQSSSNDQAEPLWETDAGEVALTRDSGSLGRVALAM